jgi:hypothetical protein
LRSKYALILALCSATLFGGLVGCADKKKDKVNQANADLDRMGQIDNQLQQKAVFISSPSKSEEKINSMDANALKETDTLIVEFIRRGQNVVATAQMNGVQYPESKRKMVAAWVESAEHLHRLIEARSGNPAAPAQRRTATRTSNTDSPDFWPSWHRCNALNEKTDWTSQGIELHSYSPSRDRAKISKLNPDQKAQLKKDAQQFAKCIKTIIDGKIALSGTDDFPTERAQLEHIQTAVKVL